MLSTYNRYIHGTPVTRSYAVNKGIKINPNKKETDFFTKKSYKFSMDHSILCDIILYFYNTCIVTITN